MITRMTALLVALGLPGAVLANGVPGIKVPVSGAPTQGLEITKTERFVVRPELGRAWVEVDLYDPLLESLKTYRIAVPGMHYDASRAAVVLAATGEEVICAKVSEGGWPFRHQRVRPTGACSVQHRYVTQAVDNGYTVDEVRHLELFLAPTASPPRARAQAG